MEEEDKKILLNDLSARIPYGVRIAIPSVFVSNEFCKGVSDGRVIDESGDEVSIERVRPFLRPMCEMTEDEMREYRMRYDKTCPVSKYCAGIVDFFLEHHLDFRGLIKRGLAYKAPEGMYCF